MAPEFFVHGKNYNPLDDYRGLPAMKVAQSPVLLKWYMDRHNQMFFKDGARPDVIIKTPSVLKDDARGSLRDAWRRAGRAGQSRGVFLAEGNLEVTEWGVTAKDGEFLGLDKLKREEVLAIFGVPPVMVGVFEFANYANSTQQMRIFYEFTIKPICTLIQDSINSQLLPVWYSGDPGLYVAFDFSDIKPLQDDALKQAQVDEIQVRSGIKTVNEVRQDAGMAPVAWGDEPPAPATLSGLGGVMPNDNMPAKSIRYHPVTPKALVAPTRADQWKAFDRDLIRNERKVEKAAREFFAAQAARVIEAFDKVSIFAAAGIPMEVRAISVDDLFALFDLDVENQEIKDAIIPVLRQIVGGTGQDAIDRVGSDAIFNIRDPRIEAYFAAKELKVTAINTTTREMLRQVLIDAAADDATIAETARSIRGMFNDMSTARAEVIARTETISAQNGAAIEGYSQSGVVDEKEWLAVMDDATRDSHAMVDGTTTNLDGLFANGLAFPGDPNGPPEETINCRCAVLPVIRD